MRRSAPIGVGSPLPAFVFLVSAAEPQAPVLTILQFNDDYQLTAVDQGKAGGLDRLAAVVKEYRRREPCSLLLFAGDLISPSLESSVFKGAQLIDGLNLLGVDAATFGNHEFDYGPAELVKRVAESRFPWVASNTFAAPGARPFPGARTYMIRNACGTSVGILGLLTEETATSSSPGTTWFGDPVAVAKTILQVMPRGYPRIVTLTHLHMQDDEGLLRAGPEIDVAIGGDRYPPPNPALCWTPLP